MATMYYLFFSILFTAICSDNGDGSGVLSASMPAHGIFILLDQNEAKNQGLAAPPKFKSWILKIKNSPDVSGSDSLIFLTVPLFKFLMASQPRPFFKASAIRSICTISENVAFDIFKNLKEEARSIVLKISSDEFLRTFCGKKYEPRHGSSGIKAKHSADEDNKRIGILNIATAELGLKESTGNNDDPRVDNSLRLAQPKPFYSASATRIPLQSGLMSPVKLLTIAEGSTTVQSKGSSDKGYGYNNLMLDGIHELTGFGWTLGRYQVSRPSGMEDKRNLIIAIASAELGVKESTGNNDDPRVDNSLRLAQPRPFFKASTTSISLQSGLMSPVKLLTIAEGSTTVQSKGSSDKAWTLGRYQVSRSSGMEDKRNLIITIASAELGVKESTGNNDGPRIEQYLAYTGLTKGYEWCAAFVSWCYGRAGLAAPRNPWSPALFPKARTYWKEGKSLKGRKGGIEAADIFGIYGTKAQRIVHVGLVKEQQGQYLISIEGNSNNRVESRRRHLRTVYAVSDWMDEKSSTL